MTVKQSVTVKIFGTNDPDPIHAHDSSNGYPVELTLSYEGGNTFKWQLSFAAATELADALQAVREGA